MSEMFQQMLTFLKDMDYGGAYAGITFLAFLYLVLYGVYSGTEGETQRQNRHIAVGFLVYAIILCNPVTALVYQKITGMAYSFRVACICIPATGICAFAASNIVMREKEGSGTKRAVIAAGLLLAIMSAGTILPFSEKEELSRKNDMCYTQDHEMIRALTEVSQEMQESGEVPYLVAPKEIMNVIRYYDHGICLAYGRDLWETDIMTYLHDQYQTEQIVLCQKMEEGGDTTEVAELALSIGCNMIVCREDLSDTFMEHQGLYLYAEYEGLYLYVRG